MGQRRQGRVPEDAALDIIHQVESRADDAVIHAERMHFGHRHVGCGQRRHDTEFTIDGMGRRQELAGRFAPQDIAVIGGGNTIGRVGLAAFELLDRNGAMKSCDIRTYPRPQARPSRSDAARARASCRRTLRGGIARFRSSLASRQARQHDKKATVRVENAPSFAQTVLNNATFLGNAFFASIGRNRRDIRRSGASVSASIGRNPGNPCLARAFRSAVIRPFARAARAGQAPVDGPADAELGANR